jgi:thiamine biosynthesis lipoprotein
MNHLSRCKPLLGTFVEVSLAGDVSDDELIKLSHIAFNEIQRIHNLMSFHSDKSELNAINQQAYLNNLPISVDTQTVLKHCLTLSEQSTGLFDITIAGKLVKAKALPDKGLAVDNSANWQDISLEGDTVRFKKPLLIDLGGVAKGYAVDCAIELMPSKINIIINAGGDIRMSHWQQEETGIRCPYDNGKVFQIAMQAPAIATSASYFLEDQSSVIYNTQSAQAIDNNDSYSIFANTCILADSLTKVAFIDLDIAKDLVPTLGASIVVITRQDEIEIFN